MSALSSWEGGSQSLHHEPGPQTRLGLLVRHGLDLDPEGRRHLLSYPRKGLDLVSVVVHLLVYVVHGLYPIHDHLFGLCIDLLFLVPGSLDWRSRNPRILAAAGGEVIDFVYALCLYLCLFDLPYLDLDPGGRLLYRGGSSANG